MQLIEILKDNLDYGIWGVLGLMSFIMLWKTLERYWFYRSIDLKQYGDIHQLDNALEENLTPIYTVGASAPYVGLLGTVIGILITFYDIGQAEGEIEAGKIMIGLALALKSTALGIAVALPAVMFYNSLSRQASFYRNQWLSEHEKV